MDRDPAAALASTLSAIDRLEAEGSLIEALDQLAAHVREHPEPELLSRLVELRHRAAAEVTSVAREPWPPAFEDPFPEVRGRVPEIDVAELTSELMGATIAHHGSIIVRGLFDPDQVDRTRASVVAATEARAARTGPLDQRGLHHYGPTLGLDQRHNVLRVYVAQTNGVWLGDSPASLAQVLDDLDGAGVVDVVAEHFGERPLITLEKSTLRRILPEYRFTTWHQDGSFLGEGTRALNVWVALTPCGGDRPAPGLHLVADRMSELLPGEGGTGRATIAGPDLIDHLRKTGLGVDVPTFDPGDALLFDELMCHRTYLTEEMTEERLALECWFFAPSHPAGEYVSLLV